MWVKMGPMGHHIFIYFIIHEGKNPRKGLPFGENYKIHLYNREEKSYNAPERAENPYLAGIGMARLGKGACRRADLLL